jgi:hypothetical protein
LYPYEGGSAVIKNIYAIDSSLNLLKQNLKLNFTTMLAISFYNLHIEGGIFFTFPLFLMLATNFSILIYLVIAQVQKKQFNTKWLEAVKQIGGLAAAWGVLSTIIGLFNAFDALEAMNEMVAPQIIMGGLKVAVITVIYGLSIFCVSMFAYIILKLVSSQSNILSIEQGNEV